MEKELCPIGKCSKPCTNDHRLSNHIKGAHMKHGDRFDDVKKCIKDSNLICKDSLLKRLEENEPEVTVQDEFLSANISKKKINTTEEPCLNSYLDIADPFCREERQYAYFLAQKIQKGKYRYILSDDANLKIIKVYYEAAFMRDYQYRMGEKFNVKLMEYLNEEIKQQNNKGNKTKTQHQIATGIGKESNHANHWKSPHPLAQWLMNAKPDIAVLCKEGKIYKMYFIECKYESPVDDYKKDGFKLSQIETQVLIQKYLCNHLELKYKVGPSNIAISPGGVVLVRFVSNPKIKKKNNSKNPGKYKEIQINISKLINETCTSPSTAAPTK